jgi:hypothetical protein
VGAENWRLSGDDKTAAASSTFITVVEKMHATFIFSNKFITKVYLRICLMVPIMYHKY